MGELPVLKKNDIVELEILDLDKDGGGIGRYQGFTLFVKNAVPGDLARVLVMKVKKSYGYAKVQEVLRSSPYRVEPLCPLASKCGGCQLQHISYERQLQYKKEKVMNCLLRIGGIEDIEIEEVIGMEEPYFYRNKALFPLACGRDKQVMIGFYAEHSHTVVDIENCCIQPFAANRILQKIREFIENEQISLYEEGNHTGLLRNILIRLGFQTGDVMVCLVMNGKADWKRDGKAERLVAKLKEIEQEQEHYRIQSVCFNINTEQTNVVMGEKVVPVYGEPYIQDYIGSILYRISPLSFYQVNPVQTVKLYEKVKEYAGLTGNEIVWDLYCGIGTISLFLAGDAKFVYGVEIVPQAVADAIENARMNGISNVKFLLGAAEDVMREEQCGEWRAERVRDEDAVLCGGRMRRNEEIGSGEEVGSVEEFRIGDKFRNEDAVGGIGKVDVVVVDPPRKGCDERLLGVIVKSGASRVVYVSCDPATLARDVKILGDGGYVVERVTAVDMFGMSGHVETVVLLERKAQ